MATIKRLAWLLAIWCASVAAVGVVSLALRFWLHPQGGPLSIGQAAIGAEQGVEVAAGSEAASACKALARADFSRTEDAPTQITGASVVGATSHLPAYCRVTGKIAPQIGFALQLPVASDHASGWNGKLIEVGNYGWAGSINDDSCTGPLLRGFACIASDMGHRGDPGDAQWARNNLQAQIDFGFRAAHVVALAAKSIVTRFYEKAAHRAYFIGCSTGGYEGLVEAQRFPWDFDGIVAGSPDMDEAELAMRGFWNAHTAAGPSRGPLLSTDDVRILHAGVLAACDADDGMRDGIIGNPMACKFDPSVLQCKSGESTNCLGPNKVEAIRRLYAGPPLANGARILARSLMPGSEGVWNDPAIGLVGWPDSSDALFQNMVYGFNPQWRARSFDFDHDYTRLGLAALYANTDPDLRKFKSAQGKLIVYQGTEDVVEIPGAAVDYYETVERTMGGRAATQDFFRFFLIPGMNHCGGGDGAGAIDALKYIDAWVQDGKAPDAMIASHVSEAWLASLPTNPELKSLAPHARAVIASLNLRFPLDPQVPVDFTRPVYPYPVYARYAGSGDPKLASSFKPAN